VFVEISKLQRARFVKRHAVQKTWTDSRRKTFPQVCLQFYLETRVARLVKVSPMVDVLENYKINKNISLLFSQKRFYIKFDKIRVGLHFG
jgi:hypothetical protein